ncbi:uncharacterized protein DDB_G0287625-like [Onthophagus taurus]|uniref:uncharacterized protein DDB_G0287625-like n=1 Tax=Onthophagus taurus TaxID=166361 RepID=UPI0039BE4682
MNNLFKRLTISVSEELKLRILRKNILPFYQTQLTLVTITTENQLIELCRTLDSTRESIVNFVPPTLNKTTIESDLAYNRGTKKILNTLSVNFKENIDNDSDRSRDRCRDRSEDRYTDRSRDRYRNRSEDRDRSEDRYRNRIEHRCRDRSGDRFEYKYRDRSGDRYKGRSEHKYRYESSDRNANMRENKSRYREWSESRNRDRSLSSSRDRNHRFGNPNIQKDSNYHEFDKGNSKEQNQFQRDNYQQSYRSSYTSRTPENNNITDNKPNKVITCYRCGQRNHYANHCILKKSKN